MAANKKKKVWEFGDFQTPQNLAIEAVAALKQQISFTPKTIIEPTCGVGSFLLAAGEVFQQAEKIIGVDIEGNYLDELRREIRNKSYESKVELIHADFFKTDWLALLKDVPKPILVIGNPPWVTNADLGSIKGKNLPQKSNFQNRKGLDAVTGKANFDISEWMLIQHMNWLTSHTGCVAMLCKTSVARKILLHSWKRDIATIGSRMIQIDAMRHFGAAVDACFFVVESNNGEASTDCSYYQSFEQDKPSAIFGYHEGVMLSNVPKFHQLRDLNGCDKNVTPQLKQPGFPDFGELRGY